MKPLDWAKRAMFLLFLHVAVIFNSVHSCSLSDDDGARVAANAFLRLGDIVSNWIPIGPVVGGFWLLFDATGRSTDLDSQITCYLEKYLRAYHLDRVDTVYRNLVHKFNLGRNDPQKMDELRAEIEHTNTISKIQSSVENIQGAIYPMIPLWSTIHLLVYKQLIYLPEGGRNTANLKTKSDQWLLFYAKLMLRYGRTHKHKMIERMSMSSVKDSPILKSPAELMEDWVKLAQRTRTRTSLTNMLDSCRLTSGSTVQFKRVFEEYTRFYSFSLAYTMDWRNVVQNDGFLSCTSSGSNCRIRNCAKRNILRYDSSWACPGETFWIYSNDNEISHYNVVNIQYSTHQGKSYWLSKDVKTSSIFDGHISYDTKTCPGLHFDHIHSDCDKENWKIREWDTSTGTNIYDGSFIQFSEEDNFVLEVYIYDSEYTKTERIYPPF